VDGRARGVPLERNEKKKSSCMDPASRSHGRKQGCLYEPIQWRSADSTREGQVHTEKSRSSGVRGGEERLKKALGPGRGTVDKEERV